MSSSDDFYLSRDSLPWHRYVGYLRDILISRERCWVLLIPSPGQWPRAGVDICSSVCWHSSSRSCWFLAPCLTGSVHMSLGYGGGVPQRSPCVHWFHLTSVSSLLIHITVVKWFSCTQIYRAGFKDDIIIWCVYFINMFMWKVQTDKQSILPIFINIFDKQKKGKKKSSTQTKKSQ